MLNVIISTIVFFIAAWLLNSYLDAQGIPKGVTRAMMVLLLASLMSWGTDWALDWTQVDEAPQTVAQVPGGLSQVLKAAGQTQP